MSLRATAGSEAIPVLQIGDCFVAALLARTQAASFSTATLYRKTTDLRGSRKMNAVFGIAQAVSLYWTGLAACATWASAQVLVLFASSEAGSGYFPAAPQKGQTSGKGILRRRPSAAAANPSLPPLARRQRTSLRAQRRGQTGEGKGQSSCRPKYRSCFERAKLNKRNLRPSAFIRVPFPIKFIVARREFHATARLAHAHGQ